MRPHTLQSWTEEEREHHFVFGAQEWARHLMELLRIYQRSTNDRQRCTAVTPHVPPVRPSHPPPVCVCRQAVLEANRLVWLVGATAFLNDCAPGSWGDMLDLMRKAPLHFPNATTRVRRTLLTGRSMV
jgi:hypothetical protein